MSTANGSEPAKTPEEASIDLRGQLEDKLGPEKTETIWHDPQAVEDVVEGTDEAAGVAAIALKAWQGLLSRSEPEATADEEVEDEPEAEEEAETKDEAETEDEPKPKRRSRLGRLVRLLLGVGVIAFVASKIKGRRHSEDEL